MMRPFPFAWRDPQLWEGIFRAGDVKGDLPSQIDPYLHVGIQALDLDNPEFLWLRRWVRRQVATRIPAPGAGIFAQCGLYPVTATGQRSICVVEKVIISNPAGSGITALLEMTQPSIAVTYPTSAFVNPLDDRAAPFNVNGHGGQFTLVNVNAATSVVDSFAIAIGIPATSSVQVDLNAVLTARLSNVGPSSYGVWVAQSAVNLALDVAFIYRERLALVSEVGNTA